MTFAAPNGLKRPRDAVLKARGAAGIAPLMGLQELWTQAPLSFPGGCHGRPRTPTFVVEDVLHLHAAPGVGDAQGTAGDQALGRGRPVSGPHQAPVGFVVGPLQDFHGLATADGELGAVAGREVVDHHGQLAAAGQLGRRGHRSGSVSPPRACSR